MIRIFIAAIILYLLFLACYLVWEHSVKRKRNAAKKTVYNPFKSAPKEDIIGKSKFTIRHSQPEDTTLIQSEKRMENAPIFADGNEKTDEKNTPAAIPSEKLDEVFSSSQTEDNSGENEIIIDYVPEEEFEPEDDEGEIDTEESEDENADEPAGVSYAHGLKFDDLSGMLQTVENAETATTEEKEEAGRVLVEVRKTDMFEQIVSGEPKKKVVVGKLMDDYFTAFHSKHSEAQPEPEVKAPTNFDVRSFA